MSRRSLRCGRGLRFLSSRPGAVGLGDHLVAVLVEVVVMAMAQQHQVVEVSGAAVEPVNDVVRVAA